MGVLSFPRQRRRLAWSAAAVAPVAAVAIAVVAMPTSRSHSLGER